MVMLLVIVVMHTDTIGIGDIDVVTHGSNVLVNDNVISFMYDMIWKQKAAWLPCVPL